MEGGEMEHDRATEGAGLKFIMPLLPQKWGKGRRCLPTRLKSFTGLKEDAEGPVCSRVSRMRGSGWGCLEKTATVGGEIASTCGWFCGVGLTKTEIMIEKNA